MIGTGDEEGQEGWIAEAERASGDREMTFGHSLHNSSLKKYLSCVLSMGHLKIC